MGKRDIRSADVEELREYRKAKSSGRLFILPEGWIDGDVIWKLDISTSRISSHMIIEWLILTGRLFAKIAENEDFILFSPDDIGVSVFKTKEEAEAALEAWNEVCLIAEEVSANNEEEEEADIVGDNRSVV